MKNLENAGEMHTILLIDPDIEECYTHLATSLPDCQVIVQSDKEKGCKLFFHHTVDLVLLAHMPDNPCIDLLQVLRFIAPSVPVIIVIADGSEELAVTLFKCGAIDYLKKPLTVNALKKSIHAALGGAIDWRKIASITHRMAYRRLYSILMETTACLLSWLTLPGKLL